MPDREKVIKGVHDARRYLEDREWVDKSVGVHIDALNDAIAMLKEQELPTELKQKMWNALYAEEEEYEKKFVGKEEHLNWFTVYRPWLQKGFDIAINTIADWKGR